MKIVYSYITTPSEGGKIHIDSFMRAYRELGETVIENGVLVEPYRGGKESWSLAKRLGVKLQWVIGNIQHFWRTFCIARKQKPDALLFRFQPQHDFFLSIVGLSALYPVVLEINAVRSLENHVGRPKISDVLDRYSLIFARRSFGVSRRTREHLLEHYPVAPHRVAVIENGVDVDTFSPSVGGDEIRTKLKLEGRFVVGFVGSFQPWHGINYLIEMAEKVLAHLPHVYFVLVGDGVGRPSYEKHVQEKGLGASFVFTGRVAHAEVPKYLAAMDVVLAPVVKGSFSGEFHGSPLKVFEYMAMAKPVITPPIGQTREIIQHMVSGLLIDSEDTDALARTIRQLYETPTLCRELGINARRRVTECYTWKENARKVRELCKEAHND